jgi:DNA-binding GntR family transcriptional regulator
MRRNRPSCAPGQSHGIGSPLTFRKAVVLRFIDDDKDRATAAAAPGRRSALPPAPIFSPTRPSIGTQLPVDPETHIPVCKDVFFARRPGGEPGRARRAGTAHPDCFTKGHSRFFRATCTEEAEVPRPRKVFAEGEAAAPVLLLPTHLVATLVPSLPKPAQVYELMRRAIVTFALPPGSAISEKAICEQLGISRTPFREALLHLSSENLVTVIPHKGTYVSHIELQNVFDGQLVRDALEMKAVRFAAVKLTPRFLRQLEFNLHQQVILAAEPDYDGFYDLDEAFHRLICEFGASPRIWRLVNGAKAQLDRVRRLAFPVPSHLETVLTEHTAIVDALRARDPGGAAESMQVHLDGVFIVIRELIIDKSDYFSRSAPDDLRRFEAALQKADNGGGRAGFRDLLSTARR